MGGPGSGRWGRRGCRTSGSARLVLTDLREQPPLALRRNFARQSDPSLTKMNRFPEPPPGPAGIPAAYPEPGNTRWWQLFFGVVAMMAISSTQYTWTFFVKPFQGALKADLATVQWTFSILVVLQTWFSPCQGFLIEKFGPKLLLSLGAVLTGLSWVLAAHAHSVSALYLSYGVLSGLGTGIIYVGVVGLMVGWFPDRRGFATGMAAAGYGMGAILTTFPITSMIARAGYQQTLVFFGLLLGGVGVLAALGVRAAPLALEERQAAAPAGLAGVGPRVMLKAPLFWLLFLMMTMMATGGLMVISQFAAFSKDFGMDKMWVFGLAAVPLAATIDRFCNGLTRPFFGWVSDRIGREHTMALAFTLEALAILSWVALRGHAVAFVLLSGVVFFGWGEIFSLFPSTLADLFGPRHATLNYGFLYMAQGIGSLLGGPLAALLHERLGSWLPVFYGIAATDLTTALLALFVLKPWHVRWLDTVPTPLGMITPAA